MGEVTAVVHLIGFPGAGKYTIAKAIGRADSRYVVIDNHLTANVIFAALDVDGLTALPDAVWTHVGAVRTTLFRAIEDLAPADRSYVFTNVLTAEEPRDRPVVDQVAGLAERRGSRYVPVRLRCDRSVLLDRVVAADRRARFKWIDPEGVGRFFDERTLIDVTPHPVLDLDVSELSPDEAARRVLEHVATALRRRTARRRS